MTCQQLGVPAPQRFARDPRNVVSPEVAVWCVACGAVEDLVLRGERFLCRDQWACQEWVRQKSNGKDPS